MLCAQISLRQVSQASLVLGAGQGADQGVPLVRPAHASGDREAVAKVVEIHAR